jgi:hypothetical protein
MTTTTTTTTELAYLSEKFEDLQLLENFVPLLNKKGQAKLAFVEAKAAIIEKDGVELPKLQFRFICEGVGESRIITYTGWIKEALSEISKLGQILKGFKLVDFHTPEAEIVDEFDFENNFINSKQTENTISFAELMTKLQELEGVIVLAQLEKDKGIWHRPDPTTFEFRVDKKGEYYRAKDISSFKKD